MPADPKKLPKPEPLTKGDQFSVSGFSWSPDGKRIAFSATRDPDLGSQDTEQIYVLDLADLHVQEAAGDGRSRTAGRSGRRTGRRSPSSPPTGSSFSSTPTATSPRFPAEGGPAARADRGRSTKTPNLIDWGPDGIYFAALAEDRRARVPPRSRQRARSRRISGPDAFHAPRRVLHQRPPHDGGGRAPRPIISPKCSSRPPPISRPSTSPMWPRSRRISN